MRGMLNTFRQLPNFLRAQERPARSPNGVLLRAPLEPEIYFGMSGILSERTW